MSKSEVKIGSRWRLKPLVPENPDPFRGPVTAIVEDVKSGWIKYKFSEDSMFSASMLQTSFIRIYEPMARRKEK